jgi:hypothetical protein
MCLYFIISHTKKICELTHNYGIIHTYFKVNHVIMTMSINSEIQLILTNDKTTRVRISCQLNMGQGHQSHICFRLIGYDTKHLEYF